MRTYSIIVMAVSTLILTIVLACAFNSGNNLINPESDLSGNEFKKHINFEYYQQQERDYKSDKKDIERLSNLTSEQWQNRWKIYQEVNIKEITHKSRGSLFSEFTWFLIFSLLLGFHIYLFRRSERRMNTFKST